MKTFQERMAEAANATKVAEMPSQRPSPLHVLKIDVATGKSEWVLPPSLPAKKAVAPAAVVKAPVTQPKRHVPLQPALDRSKH